MIADGIHCAKHNKTLKPVALGNFDGYYADAN